MKVVLLHEQAPKLHTNPKPTQKSAHQGPKKSKMTPTLSENQNLQLKKTKKIKVVQLHEQIPIQFLNPTLTPKIGQYKILTNQEPGTTELVLPGTIELVVPDQSGARYDRNCCTCPHGNLFLGKTYTSIKCETDASSFKKINTML